MSITEGCEMFLLFQFQRVMVATAFWKIKLAMCGSIIPLITYCRLW